MVLGVDGVLAELAIKLVLYIALIYSGVVSLT